MAVQTKTMAAMIDLVRRECTDVLVGDQQQSWRPIVQHHLTTAQRMLWLSHAWPHLKYRLDFAVEGGKRYYNLDTLAAGAGATIELEGIRVVECIWNGTAWTLDYGISAVEYATFNSTENEQSSPPQRWDIVSVVASDQPRLELWPISDVSEGRILITANRPLKAFEADADICTLDATLIVKVAAADLLSARKAPNAQRKTDEAGDMLSKLVRGSAQQSYSGFSFAGRPGGPTPRAPGRLLAPRG